MVSITDWVALLFNYDNLSWFEIVIRIFITLSLVLSILWLIPFTKGIAQSLLGHKYRLTWLFIAGFFRSLWKYFRIIGKHLTTDKREIFRSLKTDLAEDEDRIRGREIN